jgi:hypothetical protein
MNPLMLILNNLIDTDLNVKLLYSSPTQIEMWLDQPLTSHHLSKIMPIILQYNISVIVVERSVNFTIKESI